MGLGNLKALPSGEKVFIDSNILTYHLLNDPIYGKRCKEFIDRIENRDLDGFISPIIVSETLFNFIKATIVKNYGIRPNEITIFLKTKIKVIRDINIDKASELFEIFNIISISKSEIKECYKAIKDYALLTNDAFHVSAMKKNMIENIATNDKDFERVEWINIWKP